MISKLQSGYDFLLNGGAVSLKRSKQATIANSTTKAEYVSPSEATKEGKYILGVLHSIVDPITFYCEKKMVLSHKIKKKGLIKNPIMYWGATISLGS